MRVSTTLNRRAIGAVAHARTAFMRVGARPIDVVCATPCVMRDVFCGLRALNANITVSVDILQQTKTPRSRLRTRRCPRAVLLSGWAACSRTWPARRWPQALSAERRFGNVVCKMSTADDVVDASAAADASVLWRHLVRLADDFEYNLKVRGRPLGGSARRVQLTSTFMRPTPTPTSPSPPQQNSC